MFWARQAGVPVGVIEVLGCVVGGDDGLVAAAEGAAEVVVVVCPDTGPPGFTGFVFCGVEAQPARARQPAAAANGRMACRAMCMMRSQLSGGSLI
jgi:hypothetical protein